MKALMLGGVSLLALAALAPPAAAGPIEFTYTGTLVTFTVPTTGTYQILAFGAQGGHSAGFPASGAGGLGAEVGGDFSLTAGEVLQIAVGGAGMPGTGMFGGGGGGGGSFVVGSVGTPLAIAGGGGGGGTVFPLFGEAAFGIPGEGGLAGPNGGGGGGMGGSDGNGGSAGGGALAGGGGGGFLSPGKGSDPDGGGAFPDLTGGLGTSAFDMGGGNGGFGGGGGGFGGAGGGGGYSGGGGGGCVHEACSPGGGGGSFEAAATGQILLPAVRIGNGEVVISEVMAAVPEPASIALVGAGLLSLAAARRRGGPKTRAILISGRSK